MVALPEGSASYGYDGSADETAFHKIMDYSASSRYGVNTPSAFKATNVAGQALQVSLAAGTAWCAGVVDIMPTAQTVQLNAATSTRWDMVVLRRDWQPTIGVTTIEVIQGTSAKELPSRNNNGGVIDDQPLWLLRIEPGQSVPAEFVDLRLWARTGGVSAKDDLVRSYLQTTGTEVEINGRVWKYRNGVNDTNEWVELPGVADKEKLDGATSGAPMGLGTPNALVRRDSGGHIYVRPPTFLAHPATKFYVDELIDDVIANMLDIMPQVWRDRVEVTPSKADDPTSKVVNFPSGHFTRTPTVQVTANVTVPGNVHVSVTDVSKTSCRVWVERNSTTTTGVYVTAIAN